jgi:autotransporter-associated beta strand protein
MVAGQKAYAGSGTWIDASTGGNWSSGANWASGNIANGTDAVADFSILGLSANNTVHLDSLRTVGQLNFGDQNNSFGWTLDNSGNFSNALTLATSTANAPVINVVNQQATISANLAGTQGLTKTGSGILELTGNSTYTGVTNISNGTLVLGSSSSSSSAPAAGAVVDLDPTLSTVTTSGGVVTGVSDLSGNGNNASNTNAPGGVTLSTINGHKAFAFNGSSGLTDSTFAATGNPETVFAVIDPTSASGPSAIVASNAAGGLEFRLYQNNLQMLREAQAGFTQSTTSIPTNTLSIVALTYNTSNGTYYLNGTAIGNTGSGNPNLTGSGTLTIGNKVSNGVNEFFSGTMGTILIYPSVLSSTDIATTEAFLAQEYAPSASTLGTTEVNLTSSSSNLSIASASQSISSLAGVANSNVYVGGGLLSVGSDGTNTTFAGNISDSGTGAVGTGGTFIKLGAGTLTLSGAVSNTGGEQVSAGSLIISGTDSTSGPSSVTGGILSISGTNSTTGPNSVSGGTLSISGPNSATGNFSIGSTGTLALSGASTASGTISFATGGTLLLQANINNITGSGASATSSAIGSPSALTYADAAVTNVELRSDTNVTFANSAPTGGTGSIATINYDVNNVSTGTGQTLTLGGTTAGAVGFATYETTINVTGGNGYTLVLPAITDANNSYLHLNANTANLTVGSIGDSGTTTVGGAKNVTIGSISAPVAVNAVPGSLIMAGTGTLALTGTNTYTGATTISSGTLALSSTGSLTATSGISIASGATFDISANPGFALPSSTAILSGSGTINGSYNHSIGTISPGNTLTSSVGTLAVNGTLTLSGGAVDLVISPSNNTIGGTFNDLINVNGPLDLVGANTLTLGPVLPSLASGTTWTVITYSGSAPIGGGSLNVSTSAFSVLTVPGAIELKYNSGAVGTDVWTGSTNTTWDTSTTNWVPSGQTSPIAFTNGDSVVFDDTASPSVTAVSLNSTVTPATVTVSSNTNNYSITGSGSIGGNAFLNKSGNSTLTIGTANTYAGTTTVSGGTIILNNTSGVGLGTGPLNISAGAVVQIGDGGADGAINPSSSASPILDNGMLVYNTTSNLNPPSTISGTGSVYLNVGSIGIGNLNSYQGGTTIAGGLVTAYEAVSFGTGPVVINGGEMITDYGKDFLNNFTLSGTAINAGGGSTSTIGGTATIAGDTTITVDGGAGLVFANTVTSTTNSLFVAGGGNGVTFEGNVSLGTGQINVATSVQLSPAPSTTITISSGITGAGTVTQNTTGTTVLSAVSTYSGNTTVSAGTLALTTGGSIAGSGNVNVLSGATLSLAASTSAVASGALQRTLGNLNITGGSVVLSPATNHANQQALTVSGLTISTNNAGVYTGPSGSGAFTGQLDIGNGEVDVQNAGSAGLATLAAAAWQGFNGGWTGTDGIISSAVAGGPKGATGVGVILNGTTYSGANTFDGISPGANDVLIKYTYYGDVNLQGSVTSADYLAVDSAFNNNSNSNNTPLTGWQNGDFNYDGVINGDDYTLMDNAYNSQGGVSLAGVSAGPAEMIAADTSQIAGSAVSPEVPEPTTFGLLGVAAVGLLARRRRKDIWGK